MVRLHTRPILMLTLLACLTMAGCSSRGIALSNPPPINEPALMPIERQLARNPKAAFKNAVRWLKQHPEHPARDEGLMLAARGLARYGNPVKAFFYLDELQDTQPQSEMAADALRLQYELADGMFNGFKTRVFWIPLTPANDEAIEMLYRVRERAPGSRLAEQSLLRTADFYYQHHAWDLAAMAYAAFAEAYPGHPDVILLRLKQASASLKSFHNIAYDPTPLLDARAVLLDLVDRTQDPELQDRIALAVGDIDRLLDEKVRREAGFYRRLGQPNAADQLLKRVNNDTDADPTEPAS